MIDQASFSAYPRSKKGLAFAMQENRLLRDIFNQIEFQETRRHTGVGRCPERTKGERSRHLLPANFRWSVLLDLSKISET